MEHNRVCVSLSAALGCFIIIESLISVAVAQVLCSNPLNIGELRVLNSKQCVDVEGFDGAGNVLTWDCDAQDDQQMIICGDGTIRNQRKNFCLTPDGSGNANVVSSPCSLLSGIPESQRWRLGRGKTFTDNGGVEQVGYVITHFVTSVLE